MTAEIPYSLQNQITNLVKVVEGSNSPGNLDGLFSAYVLESNNLLQIKWNVNCANDGLVSQNEGHVAQGNIPQVPALGYSLWLYKDKKFTDLFKIGFDRLAKRDPFPGDRISFAFMPRQFLGLVLGVKSLEEVDQQQRMEWLREIYTKRKKYEKLDIVQERIYSVIESLLFEKKIPISDSDVNQSHDIEEGCMILWSLYKGFFKTSDEQVIKFLKKGILSQSLTIELSNKEAWKASLILHALYALVMETVDSILLTRSHVSKILTNFESAMRRWRWPIKDEKDVQSILFLILRSYFKDVTDEETRPKFGHSYSKADFGIPSLELLIEAKFVKTKDQFKKVEEEIINDTVKYIQWSDRYKKLIVFIYDDTSSVQEHQVTIDALKKIDVIEDIIIVSRPSQLVD